MSSRRKAAIFGLTAVVLRLVFGVVPASSSPSAEAPAPVGRDTATAVTGNTAFALELYAKLKEQEGNLFFSPHSISTALAMTYAGARGNTAAQMAQVLHFGLPEERLHATFGALVDELNEKGKKGGYQLSVANALWGQKGYGFLEEFLDLTRTHYGAGLHEVDFERATEAARQTINAWVEEQTRDKIKELIKKGILDPLTRLVLTNAIYFKGDWASQFEKDATSDEPFTLASGEKVAVPMMHQTGDFGYMEGDNLQALELPYVGEDLSMVVLLPKRADSLPELDKSLNAESLGSWLMRLPEHEVVVVLPKFTMTSEFRLDEALRSLGITDAFSDAADFSGMNGEKDLFISAVIHKAFVDVNEEGTEAAAATAVVMRLKAVPAPPPVFRADHPFLFLIRDTHTGSILFLGRLTNPKE